MDIGINLKYQRTIANKSQLEIAKITGISQQALSTWENGQKMPTIDKCIILANYYGITLDELVGRDKLSNFSIDQRHNNGTINNNF